MDEGLTELRARLAEIEDIAHALRLLQFDQQTAMPPAGAAARTESLATLARLVHDGNWDPEPGAWPRLGRKLHWETGTALEIKKIPVAQLSYEQFRLAHLTGTDSLKLSAEEIAALKRFVEAGGPLLMAELDHRVGPQHDDLLHIDLDVEQDHRRPRRVPDVPDR